VIVVDASAAEDEMIGAAEADAKVAQALDGKTVRKRIVVPGRLVNLVVS